MKLSSNFKLRVSNNFNKKFYISVGHYESESRALFIGMESTHQEKKVPRECIRSQARILIMPTDEPQVA